MSAEQLQELLNEYVEKIELNKKLFAKTKKQNVEELQNTLIEILDDDTLRIKYKSLMTTGRFASTSIQAKLIVAFRKLRDTCKEYERKIENKIEELQKEPEIYTLQSICLFGYIGEKKNNYVEFYEGYNRRKIEEIYENNNNYMDMLKTRGCDIQVGDFIVNYYSCRNQGIKKVIKITKCFIFYKVIDAVKIAVDDSYRMGSMCENILYKYFLSTETETNKEDGKIKIDGLFQVIKNKDDDYFYMEQYNDYYS